MRKIIEITGAFLFLALLGYALSEFSFLTGLHIKEPHVISSDHDIRTEKKEKSPPRRTLTAHYRSSLNNRSSGRKAYTKVDSDFYRSIVDDDDRDIFLTDDEEDGDDLYLMDDSFDDDEDMSMYGEENDGLEDDFDVIDIMFHMDDDVEEDDDDLDDLIFLDSDFEDEDEDNESINEDSGEVDDDD